MDWPFILQFYGETDPFLFCAAIAASNKLTHSQLPLSGYGKSDPKVRLGVLLAQRRAGAPVEKFDISARLDDADPGVRRAAIQWVAEDGLHQVRRLRLKSGADGATPSRQPPTPEAVGPSSPTASGRRAR